MYAWGGISIVNALPSGLGAAAAIDLAVRARIRPCQGKPRGSGSQLVDEIASYFSSRYSVARLCFDIESEVPPASGLKSSSAVAVSLIRAIKNAFSLEELEVPRLAAELSRLAGVSLTGALDDASAAYYGGVAFTDNTNMAIIRVADIGLDLSVVIAVPRRGSRPPIDLVALRRYSHLFQEVFSVAIQGEVLRAMTLNGLLIARLLGYREDIPRKALELGALAAGVTGNGPAMFAVCRRGDEGPFVELLSGYGRVLVRRFVRVGEVP